MSETVSSIIAELDRQILQDSRLNADFFQEMRETERQLGLLQGTRTICPFLRPHFLARSRYQEIVQTVSVLSKAFETLAEAALSDERLLAELRLTEKEKLTARINPGYKNLCVTSRLDTFFDGDDFKFLEYNAESPAGVGDQQQLEKVLEKVPPVKEFIEKNKVWKPQPQKALLEALLFAYRDSGGKEEKPHIAIVDWAGVDTLGEFYSLQDYFQSQGFQTIVTTPESLEYDGKILSADGFRIDIFYKRVIIHEFLEKYDETHPLIKAYRDGNVCMANSFRVKIAHKKASFAILSDEKYEKLFTQTQLQAIRRHIPWTRNLKDERTTFRGENIELLEYLRQNQENFILKPNDDYGGKGIVFGWENSLSDWETALNQSLEQEFIVQEKVSVGKIKIPAFSDVIETPELLIDFNPFIFLNRVEGALVRLSSSSLVNITQGGGETALYVLEDF